MPFGKRRKGKHGSGRSTPDYDSSPPNEQEEEGNNKEASTMMAQLEDSLQQPKENETAPEEAASKEEDSSTTTIIKKKSPPDLVLPSEKRRGIYECDYCHSDISQLPRIRCAVCADFDLCLDCFATTDHAAAAARSKAAAHTHSELEKDGLIDPPTPTATASTSKDATGSQNNNGSNTKDVSNADATGMGVGKQANKATSHSKSTFWSPAGASAAINHDDTHGYRVCDSTRYPVLGGGSRQVIINMEDEAAKTENTSSSSSAMDVDSPKPKNNQKGTTTSSSDPTSSSSTAEKEKMEGIIVTDDPKTTWTVEEDLRLLDAIKTHGLGNWVDISEAIGGNGSIGKTPKRCMERYFDDFLGRYGHILPLYTILGEYDSGSSNSNNNANTNTPPKDNPNEGNDDSTMESKADEAVPTTSVVAPATPVKEDDPVRASKRRVSALARHPGSFGSPAAGGRSRKRYRVVRTDSLPGYNEIWSKPYVPAIEGLRVGLDVARDLSTKNELAFVKTTLAAPTKKEAETIRQEWVTTKMNEIGAPTVLPPRPEDTAELPGAELMGFMPRRGDFDIEWENEAETALADMEFTQADSEQDKALKMQVLQIYYGKQNEREKRKKFILSRNLYDYKSFAKQEEPQDERDLIHRMRLFERFHTPEEHKQFIADIIKAKKLRKEIAKLQMYRRIGIRTLLDAEKYELDKNRRQFHKHSQQQKQADSTPKTATGGPTRPMPGQSMQVKSPASTVDGNESLYKQYRPSDRKKRNLNRGTMASPSNLENKLAETETRKIDNTAIVPNQGETNKTNAVENMEMKDTADATPKDTPTEPVKDIDPITDKPDNNARPENSETAKDKMTTKEEETGEEKKATTDDAPGSEEFDLSRSRGIELLSSREVALCVGLKIFPIQYLEIKKVLIHESLTNGLLDKEGQSPGRRSVVRIDIQRRGDIVDFMVKAGWISTRLANAARHLTPAAAE